MPNPPKTENDILARLYLLYDARRAQDWLLTPHPLLHYKSPHEVIAGGRIGEVDSIVARLEDGAFS